MRLSLSLTPDRALVSTLEEGGELPQDALDAIRAAFARSSGHGLVHLGGLLPTAPLGPAEAYWRDFGKSRLNAAIALRTTTLAIAEASAWLERAPPLSGGEYLRPETLHDLWQAMDVALAELRAASPETYLHDLLVQMHPAWDAIGRVCLSLAENRADPARPFALLATYTTQLSGEAKPRHAPIARALQQHAPKDGAAHDGTAQVARITSVLKAASASSSLVKEWLETRRIFHPIALSVAEAHRFLKDVPALEDAGVMARLPDWWNAANPPRPRVTATVGESAAAGKVGTGALLGFKAEVSLFGQPLTPEEWRKIQTAVEGLVFLRGKWVEVDAKQIQQALDAWRASEALVERSGLTFAQAMRLIVGGAPGSSAGVTPEATVEDVRPWSEVVAGAWLEDALKALRSPETARPPELGSRLKATLRPYQEIGVAWLWRLQALGLGGCLADDMGLGKTLQVLAFLAALEQGASTQEPSARRPHLIVAPATLVANWLSEAAKFTPHLRTLGAHPSQMSSATLAKRPQALSDVDVVVTSYGALLRYEWILNETWDVVVLDEAQAIKNPQTLQTKAAKALQARQRLALTGTPVENRPMDLWSIFDFINPGLLGSAKQFSDFIAARQESGYGALRKLVQPYILRRLKSDKALVPDLPDKTEMDVACGLTPVQAALYERIVKELKRDLEANERTEGGTDIRRKGLVLSALMKLKQVCNHPSLATGHGDYLLAASGKMQRLVAIAEEIAERGERLLVFTQFREMTAVLDRELAKIFKRPGCVLHGETPIKERKLLVDQFQAKDGPPYFILSIKAGGTGLTLTAASHVVHFDRWWNPAVEDQATDRAYRIGQRRNVMVHKLTCAGTVEAKVADLIATKRGLAKEILTNGAEMLITELDDRALLELVTLDLAKAECEA